VGETAELFGRDQSVVSRHIQRALADDELSPESNMQKMHIASSDKPLTLYSLDAVISVRPQGSGDLRFTRVSWGRCPRPRSTRKRHPCHVIVILVRRGSSSYAPRHHEREVGRGRVLFGPAQDRQ
jgi:hypothetical protein